MTDEEIFAGLIDLCKITGHRWVLFMNDGTVECATPSASLSDIRAWVRMTGSGVYECKSRAGTVYASKGGGGT